MRSLALALERWMKILPQPWTVAMEATIFGWIYDHLLPNAQQVKVAHPLMLHAIAAAKKKDDRINAGKIADCIRREFPAECHMAPTPIRNRLRTLRYHHLLVGRGADEESDLWSADGSWSEIQQAVAAQSTLLP
jgi:transposase